MRKHLSYVVLLFALVLVFSQEIEEDENTKLEKTETGEMTRIKRQLVASASGHAGLSGTVNKKKSSKKQKLKNLLAMCTNTDFKKLQTCCATPPGSFWAKSSIFQCLGKRPDAILLKWCDQLSFNKIISAIGRYSYVDPKMRKYVYPAAVAVNCLMNKTGILTADGMVDYEAFKTHLQDKLPSVWKANIAVIVDSCIPLVNSLAVKSIKSQNDTDNPTTLNGLVLVQCMQRKIPTHCADGYSRVKSEADSCKKLSTLIDKCDKNGGQIEGTLKTVSVAVTGDPIQQPNDAPV